MSTHRIPIHAALRPVSDFCAWWDYGTLATNDHWRQFVLMFGALADNAEPTAALEAHGLFSIPPNYVGSPVFRLRWNTTKTTGDVVWDIEYRAVGGDDAESLDQATPQESLSVTDSAGSAAQERMEPTVAATAGNFTAGDTVEIILRRDGADANDTLAGVAMLHELIFEYADA